MTATKGSDALGEDMNVFEMTVEDSMQCLETNVSHYSHGYLMECREKLVWKVKQYRKQCEDAVLQNTKLLYEHRQEIETIASFYQKLMSAPMQSGRIIKAASITSSAAVEIMK